MKKIFYVISVFALTVGLVVCLFDLGEYDFFSQLELISRLEFPSPIDDFTVFIEEVKSISTWSNLNIEWYEYIIKFAEWLGNILVFPLELTKTLAIDLYYGLLSVTLILGFKPI